MMQCPNCAAPNSPAARFCSECGTPLGVPCPDCSFPNRPDAKICGGCGKRLVAERAQAERRQLTVLFVDLVGSTSLAESWDPEDFRDLLRRYQQVCTDVIQRYEGHVAQYLGDGILAYFGYPAAHEDDALRAVRSGLEILSRMEGAQVRGRRAAVRIGVHTGLVVVGDLGSGRGAEQLATGEAPNVAARVQGEAGPGTLLISEFTRRLVSGHFTLEDLGARPLKGLSRPMQLWRVEGLSSAATRFEAMTAGGLAPFVGRESEVETIRDAWDRAVHGAGQTLLVRGEAGIGKSRLLGAARSVAAAGAHEHFEAECSPYDMNNPLHPVVQMLRRRLGIVEETPGNARLARIEAFVEERGGVALEAVPLLATLLDVPFEAPYAAPELPPAKLRQRLLGVLADLQLRAPGGEPTLMVIEDLHWADPSTLELITSLVARQGDAPLLVIGSTRPELPELWSPAPNRREIRVQALPRDDARALVRGVVGDKSLPDAILHEIIERTGGIPLFVEAVTRTILESGVLRENGNHYELTGPLPPGLIPATVHDSLMARIDRLGTDKPVAQMAAAIGREFGVDLLELVAGRSRPALDVALKHMMELDLVSRAGVAPHWTYTFKHALLQDAAYESLLRSTRQEFHGRIADALTTHFPELVRSKPELLARHLEGAARTREAIPWWLEAGAAAGRRSAMQECVASLRRAIDLLETLPDDDPERVALETSAQLAIGPALMATRGWAAPEVEVACTRARVLCERTQNGQGLLAALWGLWTVRFVRGEMEHALEAADPVLAMALATDNPVLHIAGRHAVGFTRYFLGDFALAREHGEAAPPFNLEQERALVGVFQIPSSFACAIYHSQSLWFLGYPDRAEARHREAWGMIEALGIPPCTAYGLGCGVFLLYAKRDRAAIATWAERLYTLSMEEGFLLWAAQGRIYRGWAQALGGDTAAGLAELRAGFAAYRDTGSGLMLPQLHLMEAEALRHAGHADDAMAAIAEGLRVADTSRERVYEPELHRVRAEILAASGRAEAAEASFRRSIEVAQLQEARMLELRTATSFARFLRHVGRIPEARALIGPVQESFTEGFTTTDLQQARSLLELLTL